MNKITSILILVFTLTFLSFQLLAKNRYLEYNPYRIRHAFQNQIYYMNTPYMTVPYNNILYPADMPVNNTFISPGPIALPLVPHKVLFTSLGLLQNGSIGVLHGIEQGAPFASIPYDTRAYIYGIIIPQGGGWVGNIYPTIHQFYLRGKFYRVYATSPGTAKRINHYQQPFL